MLPEAVSVDPSYPMKSSSDAVPSYLVRVTARTAGAWRLDGGPTAPALIVCTATRRAATDPLEALEHRRDEGAAEYIPQPTVAEVKTAK